MIDPASGTQNQERQKSAADKNNMLLKLSKGLQ